VVRIITQERGGTSYGSGALVDITETHALVVTNWHVVRDAAGPITVVFPDGFYSAATVTKADRDWDLAALAIWRPRVEPIRLAAEPPRPGEVLTIAGYGRGSYRAAAGRCTQYVSPGRNLPFEMVELATAARQGDSGGPILNSRGELAGVLFGAGLRCTTGSYCGRVRWFLEEPIALLQSQPPNPAMIARRPQPQAPAEPRAISAAIVGVRVPPETTQPSRADTTSEAAGWIAPSGSALPARRVAELPPLGGEEPSVVKIAPASQPPVSTPQTAGRLEQLQTVLAAIGALALLYHGLRIMGRATG